LNHRNILNNVDFPSNNDLINVFFILTNVPLLQIFANFDDITGNLVPYSLNGERIILHEMIANRLNNNFQIQIKKKSNIDKNIGSLIDINQCKN